ncbi:hypothetical protein B0H14DRAFT_3507463 [Mycena olivaceomarginata]|nr:hypothetical protein B0H14DRAFT_3507463 [Mycena olivaceomarginata]
MLQQLQVYLQYCDDPFKSFEIVEPQLQLWHTKWTDVIRIFQTHWGRITGKNTNPASLGFSASRIGRAAPSNMKKVEFYPGTQLVYLVLDAKVMDIWRHLRVFEGLEKRKALPDFETLLAMARKLYRAYGTARGRDHAMYDTSDTSEWAQTVPAGSTWIPQEIEDSSLDAKKKRKSKTTARKTKPKAKPKPKPCLGDFVLAQNIDFIRDALNSRKLTTAIARGGHRKVYMLFTFGGSTHSNYLNYVLETIMNLELECSHGLKLALLRGLIWSLSDLRGHYEEGDYIVEFFNRLLEDATQHKSAQFDDIFIRNIISRNLRHIAELKVAWRAATGMDRKAQRHVNPHEKPEMRTLLKVYADTELSRRRPTRQIDDRDTDDFARGVKKLRDGALQAAIAKTTHNRQVFRADAAPAANDVDAPDEGSDSESQTSSSEESESESESDSASDSETEPQDFYATRGSVSIIDGELVFDERDILMGPEDDEYVDEGHDEPANSEDENSTIAYYITYNLLFRPLVLELSERLFQFDQDLEQRRVIPLKTSNARDKWH